jgi:pimeloyl-ACP methyl ester carboxylesterase
MADDQGALLRQEARAIGELAALHRDPVFYGRGVTRGDGRVVVVVPGLFGNDSYLQPLRGWLGRIGYSPARSTLSLNAGCPDRLRTQIERSLPRRLERRPGPLCLIGHSRGGMLAWAIASRMQEQVSHLVLLGSPAPAVVSMMRRGDTQFPGTVATSSVAAAGARAVRMLDPDCAVPNCGCPYTDDLRRPLHPATHVLSIYSRDDPIVPPASCAVASGENIEIGGSHGGLAYNRVVYGHLARFLAAT